MKPGRGSLNVLQRIRKASADSPCPCGSGIRVLDCNHRRFLRRWNLDRAEAGDIPTLSLPPPSAPHQERRAARTSPVPVG